MFENEVQTRCAICGTGILLGLVLMLAHLPIILLIGPVIILFLGIIADPEETHAVWYGMLNTLGIFDLSALTDIERLTYAEKRHYFWFGEVEMAALLAGTFAAPVGIFLAGRTDMSLAFIGAAVLFLPLFVFLPKLIQRAMKADTAAAIAFFEIVIWLLAVEVVMKDLANTANFLAYALGFAAGTYIGLVVEEKLSLGMVILRIVTADESRDAIISSLQSENHGVTCMEAQGSRGSVTMILSLVNRSEISRITNLIDQINPRAFFSIQDVRYVNEGVFRTRDCRSFTGMIHSLAGQGRKK